MKKTLLFLMMICSVGVLSAQNLSLSDANGQVSSTANTNQIESLSINPNPNGRALTGTFTDRATFQAATSSLVLEDFTGGPTAFTVCDASISSAGDVCFPAGEIEAGLEVTIAAINGGVNTVVTVPADGFGNTDNAAGSITFLDFTILNFTTAPATTAVGFDLYAFTAGADVEVRVIGAGGLISSFSTNVTPTGPSFVGVTADEDILSIELEDLAGNTVELVALVEFGLASLPGADDPIINCPMDIMADSFPGECFAEVNFATPVALDPNGGTVTVTQTMGPVSGSEFPVGDTIVEFTATNDDAPNESTVCQFTVTVNDIEPPMITCPDDITVDNEAGLCGATVMYPDPIVMDNCFNSGVSNVSDTLTTLFATGNNGAAGGAVYFDVTVDANDIMITSLDMNTSVTTAIDVEMWTRVGTASGFEEDPAGWTLAGTASGTGAGTDNPSNVVFGTPITVANSATTGVALVIMGGEHRYTNGDGTNEAFANGDLSIALGQANNTPFAPGLFAPRVWNGSINYDVMMVTGATPYTVVAGLASGDFFPVGTTTNTLQYTDAGGNMVECSFDVTVLDVEAPVIVCVGEPFGSTNMVDGQAITDTNPTTTSVMSVTDDFDIVDLNVDLNISHTWVGDMDISLTSPAGTSVQLYIGDPACSGDDMVITLDDEGTGDLAGCVAGPPAYPVGAYVPASALSAFDGESTLGDWTLEVTDNVGGDNGTLNSWGITYEFVASGGPTVILDANGVGMIDTSAFISSATDNCGIASIAVAGAGAPPPPVEACGDNIGAAIDSALAPTESTAAIAETGLIGTDYALDTVALDITHTFNGDLDIELISPLGTVLLLSDQNGGGDDNYTGTIFQDGGMDITAGTSPFTGTFQAEGGTFAATFDGEDIAGGWILRVTDNFGGDVGTLDNFCMSFADLNASQAFFGCEDIGTNSIDIVVTDLSGNESVCTSTVTVVDETAPTLVCQSITVELDENGEATVVVEDLVDMALTFDACGIEFLTMNIDGMYTCDDIGMTFTAQVFASDASNNASTCMAEITVVDALAPVLTCPAGGPVMTDPTTQTYTFPDYFATGEASALDNCTDVADIVTTQDPAPGTMMGISAGNVVTLTATDLSGNTSTCTFEVDIQVLGLEENELNAAITMYPNPANNQVTISNGSNIALSQAVIYDTNGKLINTIDLRAMQSEQVIDVAALASGIYMVQISSDNATVVKRLIKQ